MDRGDSGVWQGGEKAGVGVCREDYTKYLQFKKKGKKPPHPIFKMETGRLSPVSLLVRDLMLSMIVTFKHPTHLHRTYNHFSFRRRPVGG